MYEYVNIIGSSKYKNSINSEAVFLISWYSVRFTLRTSKSIIEEVQ